MGAFATQFEVALNEANLHQVDVAKQTNGVISQMMASRYVNGGDLPEVKNLKPLVKIFPAHIRERLVTAYLLEHIPESARDLVTVQQVSKAKTDSQLDFIQNQAA